MGGEKRLISVWYDGFKSVYRFVDIYFIVSPTYKKQ